MKLKKKIISVCSFSDMVLRENSEGNTFAIFVFGCFEKVREKVPFLRRVERCYCTTAGHKLENFLFEKWRGVTVVQL